MIISIISLLYGNLIILSDEIVDDLGWKTELFRKKIKKNLYWNKVIDRNKRAKEVNSRGKDHVIKVPLGISMMERRAETNFFLQSTYILLAPYSFTNFSMCCVLLTQMTSPYIHFPTFVSIKINFVSLWQP